ncbi:ABC transporter permease, partial [Acidihalobacter prosperus]
GGAFNNVVLSLGHGANAKEIINRLDNLLAPYGGTGAYEREHQSSHRFFSEELTQLENNSALFPVIFMGVAAFLLNVVVTRLLSTQRDQIATLKAFGYTNSAVTWHFIKLVMVIVLIGVALGIGGGAWLTRVMGNLYTGFFRLPYLEYRLSAKVLFFATLISVAAGLLGTIFSVMKSVRIKPAEAMRPEPPALYRETLIESLGFKRWMSMPTRMIVRHLGQRPLKSLLTIIGIAFAGALTMTGRFQEDTVDFMMYIHYGLTQRDDLTVTFVEPASRRALYDLLGLPGVEYGEAFRSVPVRLRHDHYSYRTGIQGLQPDGQLMRVFNRRLEPLTLPSNGLVLTDYLGRILHVHPGDHITVEILEGNRPVRQVPVVALVKQYIGVSGYMSLNAMNHLLRQGRAISGVYLRIDSAKAPAIYRALKNMPRVAGVSVRQDEISNFQRIMQETMLFWSGIATLFAAIIAFGVVYNAARITLTERGRELASLRVLGFTRGEISYILLGELALVTLAAVPFGLLLGRWLCGYIATTVESDLYRVPLVVQPASYAFSVTVVILSAALSGLLVRRRLDHLDLIAVLKTRE